MRNIKFLEAMQNTKIKREQGLYRKLVILEWLMRWRYSTPKILSQALKAKQPSVARSLSAMSKERLIDIVNLPHPIMRRVILPSTKGSKLIRGETGRSYGPRVSSSMINLSQLCHSLCIQEVCSMLSLRLFKSESEIKAEPYGLLRCPDLIYPGKGGDIAVEVESSRKTPLDRERMLSTLASSLQEGTFSRVFIMSHDMGIIRPIKKELQHKQLPKYRKHNDTRKVIKTNNLWISLDDVRDRIRVNVTSMFDSYYI